eukprot:TRINITY_DN71497_c0_g1_i1.p2 TRINITY_DN71497_c0_g1~~TRINITY_DN71497_c0_g1_i1.p2  ORF type:complete len:131 (+),score=57.88 TRINITY_DN71497_c0_g1_i1:83-475(+)
MYAVVCGVVISGFAIFLVKHFAAAAIQGTQGQPAGQKQPSGTILVEQECDADAAVLFEKRMEQMEERLCIAQRFRRLPGKAFECALLNCRIKALRRIQSGQQAEMPTGPAWQNPEAKEMAVLAFKARASQ